MERLPRRAGLRGENGANEHGGVTFIEEGDFDVRPSTASLLAPTGDWVSCPCSHSLTGDGERKKQNTENALTDSIVPAARTRIAALERCAGDRRRNKKKKHKDGDWLVSPRQLVLSAALEAAAHPAAHLITRPRRRSSAGDMPSNKIALSYGNWPFVMSPRGPSHPKLH